MKKNVNKPAEQPAYYESIELVPEGHWNDIDFIRAPGAPPEPSDMRALRVDIQNTARVITSFLKKDKDTRNDFLEKLHVTADTGLRGRNFDVAAGRDNLANVKQELLDHAYKIRSELLAVYNRIGLRIGLPLLVLGGIASWMASHGKYLPAPDAKGVYTPEIVTLIAVLWIPAAAIAGAWAEFALRAETLTFDRLLYFDPGRWEPRERMLIVVVVAGIFAFILAAGAITVGVGNILLNEFATTRLYCALAVGFFTGFSFPYVRDILYRLRPTERS